MFDENPIFSPMKISELNGTPTQRGADVVTARWPQRIGFPATQINKRSKDQQESTNQC
jgi:hypothetical protein